MKSLALAAEILGGAAVVVTLIFLVLETQENTRAIQAQSYLALTSQLNRLRESLLDPEVASVFTKGMLNRDSLASPADQLIFGQLFEAAFAIYESAYYARQKGIR